MTRKQLKNPSRFLEALDKQSGEAVSSFVIFCTFCQFQQYFFSSESLEVVLNMVDAAKVDGVICVGSPRIFEALRGRKEGKGQIFMLDIDRRYVSFQPWKKRKRNNNLPQAGFKPGLCATCVLTDWAVEGRSRGRFGGLDDLCTLFSTCAVDQLTFSGSLLSLVTVCSIQYAGSSLLSQQGSRTTGQLLLC